MNAKIFRSLLHPIRQRSFHISALSSCQFTAFAASFLFASCIMLVVLPSPVGLWCGDRSLALGVHKRTLDWSAGTRAGRMMALFSIYNRSKRFSLRAIHVIHFSYYNTLSRHHHQPSTAIINHQNNNITESKYYTFWGTAARLDLATSPIDSPTPAECISDGSFESDMSRVVIDSQVALLQQTSWSLVGSRKGLRQLGHSIGAFRMLVIGSSRRIILLLL